ncbi:porin family protein [Marinoscillum furvescens]|uniref:Outer membrane protein with beta-barrel domain n=1 Tax=Marinoscillum furvescens DSM 4134 TaxID=1122208 RepID=A0A3D9L5B9_MARFU|nr:porin family protein [Marinoscillum furvescens]REE00140.1 outer membrane protein with beta-barrel domain [Marinoscillum furvescens DSM 4134]
MSRYVLLVVFACLTVLAEAQKRGFIATDTSLVSGVKLVAGTDSENAHYITRIKQGRPVTYLPHQLTQYGLKDGTVYVSREIELRGEIRPVFLERLTHGGLTLYSYQEPGSRKFYLSSDSSELVMLTEDNYRQLLMDYTADFDWAYGQHELVAFRTKSMEQLLDMYNDGENRRLNFPRMGVTAGFAQSSHSVSFNMATSQLSNSQLKNLVFDPAQGVVFGAFADMPIRNAYSFYTGLFFSKAEVEASAVTGQYDLSMKMTHTTVELPVLLRYTLQTNNWRPFLNFGGAVAYHLANETYLKEVSPSGSVHESDVAHVANLMAGASMGIGVQRYVSVRNLISAEVRFTKYPGSQSYFGKNQLAVLLSYSF